MGGITREVCQDALMLGWSKPLLAHVHEWAKKVDLTFRDLAQGGWGIVGEESLIVYRGYTELEVDDAFNGHSLTATREAVAYADGSGTSADKPAGIGCLVLHPDAPPRMFGENIGPGTNNRAELCAAWRALRAFPDTSQKLLIRTDSEYTIGALTKDWARNANATLITNIREDLAYRRGRVRFEHVDGHAGHEGNEVADRLATIGRKLITKVSLYEG